MFTCWVVLIILHWNQYIFDGNKCDNIFLKEINASQTHLPTWRLHATFPFVSSIRGKMMWQRALKQMLQIQLDMWAMLGIFIKAVMGQLSIQVTLSQRDCFTIYVTVWWFCQWFCNGLTICPSYNSPGFDVIWSPVSTSRDFCLIQLLVPCDGSNWIHELQEFFLAI